MELALREIFGIVTDSEHPLRPPSGRFEQVVAGLGLANHQRF